MYKKVNDHSGLRDARLIEEAIQLKAGACKSCPVSSELLVGFGRCLRPGPHNAWVKVRCSAVSGGTVVQTSKADDHTKCIHFLRQARNRLRAKA